jgi:hypothetical protein
MCTGSPRLEVLRRLRPVSGRSVDSGPSPNAVLAARIRARSETVPTFTVIRSTKEEPNSVPAASPRLPRSTSPWPPGPTSASRPGSSLFQRNRTGAHRARPISARFEPVYLSKDVLALVPRVLHSVTLAEPTPSGSAGASRLCRGCSHRSRHLPGPAAPSFTVPAATGPAAKVSHLHSKHQRLVAHADADKSLSPASRLARSRSLTRASDALGRLPRLWKTQPDAMKAAVERLDQILSDAAAAHHGVRPVE